MILHSDCQRSIARMINLKILHCLMLQMKLLFIRIHQLIKKQDIYNAIVFNINQILLMEI